jgi:hypothetical protein
MLKKIIFSFAIMFLVTGLARAVSLLTVPQGGTGWGNFQTGTLLTGNGTGRLATTTVGSGLSLSGGVLTATGGAFDWTVQSWGNSTTTTIGLLNGFLSTASSTITSALRLSSLTDGGLGVNNGLVYSGATTTAGTGLTYSSNAFNVNTSQNIATLSNLTGNGFVKTSGGTGLLSIDTATYESGLTAGDGLTRTVNDFDCDTASGSVFGCLASADWTTFNSKQATIGVTWPITLSGVTIGFNGLSTSSAISAASGLLYATGVNTMASISTSSAISMSITGLAGTATALAANPTNCSAGNYPLGIDASGNVESCTAAGAGGTFEWTPTTYSGISVNATSTGLWLKATSPFSLIASSTYSTYASTTMLTVDDGLAGDALITLGKASYEWSIGYDLTDNSFAISSSTALGTSNALTINKTTLKTTLASLDVDDLTSALVLTGAGGDFAEYTGASCTNQFIRSLSALGASTCATVANTDLANSTISGIALGSNLADLTATNATLTFSGTYNGGTARTIGLNLGNANTWTALQQFSNATSTQFSAGTGDVFYVDSNGRIQGKDTTNAWSGVISPTRTLVLQTGTTTTFTSTTSGAYIPKAVAPFAGTIRNAQCATDAGFLNVDIYHTSTHLPLLLGASSTAGVWAFSSNNTFTKGEVIYMSAGTTTTSLATSISCSLSVTESY